MCTHFVVKKAKLMILTDAGSDEWHEPLFIYYEKNHTYYYNFSIMFSVKLRSIICFHRLMLKLIDRCLTVKIEQHLAKLKAKI